MQIINSVQMTIWKTDIFYNLLTIAVLILIADATLIQMRVVKDTAIYGYAGGSPLDSENANQLSASVQPSNFSGPPLMRKLSGRCFNLTEERYRYTLCPFQNITQYEVSARWNAYQGILGIWSHWEIENGTFSRMVFRNGDECGDIKRSVKVSLKCGSKEELLSVSEPSRCQYSAALSTRYVCHQDALLVYPRLGEQLRKQWDDLYSAFMSEELTPKGYEIGLQKIFADARLSEPPEKQDIIPAHPEKKKFMDLLTCNKEYKKLHDEIYNVRKELETLKLLITHDKKQNRTS